MATTPEGRVKTKLDRELKLRQLWYFNPQAGPFGKSGVPDKIICVKGHMVGIECKASKASKPTALQAKTMAAIEAAGGKCFVVCDDETLRIAMGYIDGVISRGA